ncbi:hypothetical protein [Albidovulum sp.]|uniref:hypothetical protein n=1 Tax=Albidovulum sp. TaxID=1872424 RepID=UPI0039B8464D
MIVHPLAALAPWVSLPANIVKAFAGECSLPIHELEKAKVQKLRAHVRPFPDASGNVTFSAWRLAHAIKKADCLRWPSAPVLWRGATGFLLENGHFFDWSKSEFSLHDGMADYYADFTGSGLAGRIGQGMALLFLEQKGYAYVGRFETEWKQRAAAQNKSWPAGKTKAPDFIAENVRKEWVLAESKGGFASPGNKPPIKGALRDGLAQLAGWDKHITPQPQKSFAIGTFLRESNDSHDETSLIAFVDPPPEASEDPVEFPVDAVRRANYGSWLSVMGFDDAANRLRIGVGEQQRRLVPVIVLGGQKFVVSIASISPRYPDHSSREFWDDLHHWRFLPFDMPRGGVRVEMIGLDLRVFKALSSISDERISAELMELQPHEPRDTSFDSDGGAFYGSVFSDGSLLGEMRHTRSTRPFPDFEWIEVEV